MDRARRLAGHLEANPVAARTPPSPDDVVVCVALRTPIQKAGRGAFAQTHVEDLLAPLLKAVVERTKIDPRVIGDVVVGNVLGDGSFHASKMRMACLMAGYPVDVPVRLVNRQCSSGLQAVSDVYCAIRAGQYTVGLAAGVESMSMARFKWGDGDVSPHVKEVKTAADCLIPMGITSETVAARYGVTRQEQDELAVTSHARAAAATKAGRFVAEIVPITAELKDPKTGAVHKMLVKEDGGVREGTSMADLAKLKPAFKPDGGSTTAGNSSQVSDGAAVVLLARRDVAAKLNLPILGRFTAFSAVGVAPDEMGVGPAVAIPAVLRQAGLTTADVDLFEINEAFASQATYCVKKLGLSWDRVNPNGGAIALGHPLGCTGARATATLLHEMARRNVHRGVVSMCIGSGMGAAAIFERD